jgi:hypothetical protein
VFPASLLYFTVCSQPKQNDIKSHQCLRLSTLFPSYSINTVHWLLALACFISPVHLPHHLLPLFPLLTWLQPHWLSYCFLNSDTDCYSRVLVDHFTLPWFQAPDGLLAWLLTSLVSMFWCYHFKEIFLYFWNSNQTSPHF